MAAVLIMKNAEGRLEGFGERGMRAYNRFLDAVRKLEIGELLKFEYKAPRSGPYHRRHFGMLGVIFENQDRFTDELVFRKWGEVGAGYCDLLPGKDGIPCAVARSIDYESLDQIAFEPIHLAVIGFYRDAHARRFLWPHLTEVQTYEMMEMLLMGFEQ